MERRLISFRGFSQMSNIRVWASLLFLVSLLISLASAARDDPAGPDGGSPSRRKRQAEAEEFFATGPIPRLRIEIDSRGMDSLRRNGRAYVRATVREGAAGQADRVYAEVGIHLKGQAGSYRGVDDRPALTLNFDKYVHGARFHGLTKVHLNNSVQDGSCMEENLGGAIFREAGLPGPRVTNARVWLNGRHLGLYVLIEGFNKSFIRRFFEHPGGDLFDGGFCKDIDQNFIEMVDDPADDCDPRKLIEAARERDPALRRAKIEEVLDVDRFLTFMAVEALLAHWDGYCFNRNNYRIYHDPRTGKFQFLPHGMDQLFRNGGHPLVGGSVMCRAVLQTPGDRDRYMRCLREVRRKCFDLEKLNAAIDAMAGRIAPVTAEIGPGAAAQFQHEAASLKARVLDRVRNIDRMLSVPTTT